jgi:hypothetical protein
VRKDDPPAAIVPTDEGGGRSEAAGARPVDAAAERAREREGASVFNRDLEAARVVHRERAARSERGGGRACERERWLTDLGERGRAIGARCCLEMLFFLYLTLACLEEVNLIFFGQIFGP